MYVEGKSCFLGQCRGGGFAPPALFGPPSEANIAILGDPNRKVSYIITRKGNVPTLLCCEGKGYQRGIQYWASIGCGGDRGEFGGSVEWGEIAALPEVRCRGVPTGALYSWTC